MKKSNAQAEPPSSPGELLRASRPRTDIFEQNDLATGLACYVVHVLFLFFLIDYKHKHAASCGAHALNLPPPPSFLNRLQAQAQAHPRPGVKHHAAEARATVIFLLTAWNIPYKRKLESYNVKKRRQ